ncbi:MAG: 16S rRNA (adenine(1518)-N(6)/adenine(1519)-N(6))-dimethyltransferase RsmA [Phycisphaerae bacterium]
MPPHVQTLSEIRATLAGLQTRPRRRFGQNFLIDGNLMRRLPEAAELGPTDGVLEVGPGTGGLTDLLVERVSRVLAVEIDANLANHLTERFAGRDNVDLIVGDALRHKNCLSPALLAGLDRMSTGVTGRIALVANLPYNIATPLLVNLLLQAPCVTRFCFTVQRDLAERIDASPKTKAYGPLSILLQTATDIQPIAQLPPSVFWPRPKVESTLLRLDCKPNPLVDPANPTDRTRLARFAALVRDTFCRRRKKLKSALRQVLNDPEYATAHQLLDLSRRPEDLDVSEWIELATRTILA